MLSEKQMRFLIEGVEVEIPEDFSKFSGCVADFANTMCEEPLCGKYFPIVLPKGYTIEQLNLLFEFFDLLKTNLLESPHIAQQSKCCDIRASVEERQDSENDDDDLYHNDNEDFGDEDYEENLEPDGAIVEMDLEEDLENLCLTHINHSEKPAKNGLIHLDYHFKLTKLPEWSHNFLSEVPKDLLFSTSDVANYLTAHPFIEHMSLFVANTLKEMSISEIRDYLNVEKDFEEDEFETLANEENWRDELVNQNLVNPNKFNVKSDFL